MVIAVESLALALGVLALAGATASQIQEEWATRGLTDTRVRTLLLLLGGSIGLAWGGPHNLPILLCALAPGAIGLWGLWAKGLAYAQTKQWISIPGGDGLSSVVPPMVAPPPAAPWTGFCKTCPALFGAETLDELRQQLEAHARGSTDGPLMTVGKHTVAFDDPERVQAERAKHGRLATRSGLRAAAPIVTVKPQAKR